MAVETLGVTAWVRGCTGASGTAPIAARPLEWSSGGAMWPPSRAVIALVSAAGAGAAAEAVTRVVTRAGAAAVTRIGAGAVERAGAAAAATGVAKTISLSSSAFLLAALVLASAALAAVLMAAVVRTR